MSKIVYDTIGLSTKTMRTVWTRVRMTGTKRPSPMEVSPSGKRTSRGWTSHWDPHTQRKVHKIRWAQMLTITLPFYIFGHPHNKTLTIIFAFYLRILNPKHFICHWPWPYGRRIRKWQWIWVQSSALSTYHDFLGLWNGECVEATNNDSLSRRR